MSMDQHRRLTLVRALPADREPIRLDRLENPYGPSLAVYEALSDAGDWPASEPMSSKRLRRDLARLAGVSPAWILPGNGIDELLDALFLWRRDRGPLVLFPPSNPSDRRRADLHRMPVINLQRTAAFAVELDLDTVSDLPPGCWAIVQSPNDPTGTVLESHDAVRLARACELVVIDERHGAYAGRSLLPLVREFENIILVQTLETWAGLGSFPVAYAVGPPALLKDLDAFRGREEIAAGAAMAAMATIQDLAHVRSTVHRVRLERSRLYRMLRKLNMVSPCPSWANFLPVRVERGTAPVLVNCLAERGIWVYQPTSPGLDRVLRISAGMPEQTDALKQALVEIGREL